MRPSKRIRVARLRAASRRAGSAISAGQSKFCRDCGLSIPKRARLCSHCENYQNWWPRIWSSFKLSVPVMALLVALTSLVFSNFDLIGNYINPPRAWIKVDDHYFTSAQGRMSLTIHNVGTEKVFIGKTANCRQDDEHSYWEFSGVFFLKEELDSIPPGEKTAIEFKPTEALASFANFIEKFAPQSLSERKKGFLRCTLDIEDKLGRIDYRFVILKHSPEWIIEYAARPLAMVAKPSEGGAGLILIDGYAL